MVDLSGLRHRTEAVNGIRLHCVELGEGPLVLLVHGFPESWYSWRHQLPVLAEAGYRAVAIDVRGYGRSSQPTAIEEYRMLRHVGDNVALLEALGARTATIVGHDWGAPIAWASAQLRPDLFTAVAGLSVPFGHSGPRRPTTVFPEVGGEDEFYLTYVQQVGPVEDEIAEDVRGWLRGVFHALSFDGMAAAREAGDPLGPFLVPAGRRMKDGFAAPETMPGWLTEADLDVYAGEFERSGFTGPLHRYRNIDRDWEDLAVLDHRPLEVPALFVAGELDGPAMWGRRNIERFDKTLPRLHRSEILPGCGHWVQQERPDETNELLLDFLEATH